LQRLTRPNASRSDYQYDSLSRLTEIAHRTGAGQLISSYGYTYGANDQRETETVSDDGLSHSFADQLTTYDTNNLNQLLESREPDQSYRLALKTHGIRDGP
jgi:YD repeat-containing protein